MKITIIIVEQLLLNNLISYIFSHRIICKLTTLQILHRYVYIINTLYMEQVNLLNTTSIIATTMTSTDTRNSDFNQRYT